MKLKIIISLLVRGRKKPKETIFIEEKFKALEIEIKFNEGKYLELYPFENEYPLINKLLMPVLKENDFNQFLFDMIMEGLAKAEKLNSPIPHKFLEEMALSFKSNGYINEWVEKTKTFKEYGLKASFLCKMNCNYFSLMLVIVKNDKEILKTLPSVLIFNRQFKDILILNDKILVIKDDLEQTILFPRSVEPLHLLG